YSFSTKYLATTDTGQLNANAYLIGYQLQLVNNFDGFVTFPPPIGDQFVQQDRRKIYGGKVSYMMPGNLFGFDAKNTIGFQTRTDDIHIDLAETSGRVVRFTVRDDRVIESSAGVYIENWVQWLDKFRTMTGLREDLYYGSDESTLQANSGKIVVSIRRGPRRPMHHAGQSVIAGGFFLASRTLAALRWFAIRPRAYLIGSSSKTSGS